MTTIRSNPFPQPHHPPQGQESAKLAAQRAFFNAAMGQTPAATPTQPAVRATAPVAAPVQVDRTSHVAAGPQPERIPRPGSLLDIRV